jgi:hypothetical protein
MGYLVRLEAVDGSPVWIDPASVQSLSTKEDQTTIVETGHFLFEVEGDVDRVAGLLGEDGR